MISLELNNTTKTPVCRRSLERLLNLAQKTSKYRGKALVSLGVVGNQKIRQLNKTYRKIDKVTDVLSFENSDSEYAEDPIGEILVCLPVAKAQAKKIKHSLKKEVNRLVLHGFLHLIGYDHEKESEAAKMESLETKILNKYDQV
jgi:probable rRNA maturation factor